MDSRKMVIKQTGLVAAGELILSGLMLAVYAALGRFSMVVLWSAAAGAAVMILNHFMMSVTVSLAADRAQQGDSEQGKRMVQLSSTLRLLGIGAILVLGIKLGADVVALVLPLAFVRPVLMLCEFFGKKGD